MGAEPTLPLRPGDVVAGRYLVDRVLGVGGMGAVFAARDLEANTRVALKALLPEYREHGDMVTRFQREARATARLQSEHVAHVLGSGLLDSGAPYLVMEYLVGRDLKSLVKAEGALPVGDAAEYVGQACAGLAEAHALGIVHRDLKPANLFLTRRLNGAAVIKVLDFGIAKFQSPNITGDHAEMTRARAVLGSRAYMSPEQMLRPREVDARADVWALGVILYYLATGKTPFSAETIEALIINVVQGEPPPLAPQCPDLPEGFEPVVRRCLAKARENRFANVTELARALSPFTRDRTPDRATLELPPEPAAPPASPEPDLPRVPDPVPPDQTSPTESVFSVTRAEPDPEPDPEIETRSSVPSWAPTRVMPPKRRRRRSQAPMIAGAMVLGFVVALLVIRRLAPAGGPPSPPSATPAVAASPTADTTAPIPAITPPPPAVSAEQQPVPTATAKTPSLARSRPKPKALPW